jgi:diacylglycerol kinase family enzyme
VREVQVELTETPPGSLPPADAAFFGMRARRRSPTVGTAHESPIMRVRARVRTVREEWECVDPPRRAVLFINPRSGDGKAERTAIDDRARERGVEPVVLQTGDDLAALVAAAVDRGADALGIAGGDGSLATVAAAAATHDLPFICLPAGTRNHFALDLGVDRHDLIGALDAFTDPLERRIDMAEVNSRMFLNNVSLGLYGDAVRRSGYRDAKLRTILETVNEVHSSAAPTAGLLVTDDMGRRHGSPLVVLVSNNAYALDRSPVPGSRPRLDAGQLGIVVLDPPGAERPPVCAWSAPSLEIEASAPVPAGLDGEAVTLLPPLRFAARPAALRVRIARHHPGVSPSRLTSPR